MDTTYKIGTQRLKDKAPYIFDTDYLKIYNPDKWCISYWAKAVSPSLVKKNIPGAQEAETTSETKKKVRGMVVTNFGKLKKLHLILGKEL